MSDPDRTPLPTLYDIAVRAKMAAVAAGDESLANSMHEKMCSIERIRPGTYAAWVREGYEARALGLPTSSSA